MRIEDNQPVTVIVRRRIKAGHEQEFEGAMREFVSFALFFPGHQGMHIFRSADEGSQDYMVVAKFKDFISRKAFKQSLSYQEWMRRLKELTAGDPLIEEMGGISGWFALPEKLHQKPPKKYRMAIMAFLGVYPLTYFLPLSLKPLIGNWHPLLKNFLISGLVVALLTWLVMPFFSRLFSAWLFVESNTIHIKEDFKNEKRG